MCSLMHIPDGSQELVSLREAARILAVSYPTVWRYTAAGDLPVVRLSSRNVKVKRADLDHYISTRTERATA